MNTRCMGCMNIYDGSYGVCPHCGFVMGSQPEEPLHMMPGTELGDRYIVGKTLGYGGFGVTYIGWDNLLEQTVAIKEYLPSEFSTRMPGQTQVSVFGGDKFEQFFAGKDNFVAEARRLAKFHKCEGIVKVFDSFELNDTAYIVMEFLDGETLAQKLNRDGRMDSITASRMLIPVIESLKIVHDEGILHRDIAPDNIFLTRDGQVKLIDFGASRYATTSHSRSLTVIIKSGYSPAEQYMSLGDQGPHTDVYALAASLYAAITGIRPPDAFERRTALSGAKKDLLLPLSKYEKDIDADLEVAILNALNVSIEDRTPDMVAFEDELFHTRPVKPRTNTIKRVDHNKLPIWFKVLIAVLLAGLATVGTLFATGVIKFSDSYRVEYTDPENYFIVDNVYEMTQGEAIFLLDAHFTPIMAGQIKTNYKTAGTVTLQDPGAGAYLLANGTVNLYIAAPEEVVLGQVPYVIASPKEEAIASLISAGVAEADITVAEEHSETVAAGLVISQSVEAGTEIVEGEENKITIVVSLGAEAKEVPDVSGMTYEQAKAVLEDAGYVVSKADENSDTVPENTVIRQSHTEAVSGTAITLTVSAGRNEVLVSVPNVVGQTEANAARSLSNAGFTVAKIEAYSDTVLAGNVISTNPVAGTQLTEGSQVTITVSKGVDPAKAADEQRRQQEAARKTTVPNVTGQSESSARSAISTASLNVSVTNENSDTVAAGNVIRQSPAAGTSVDKNSTVTIVVSSGAAVRTVTVPNVVGSTEAVARNILSNGLFEVSVVTEESASVARGNVIRQTPAGGTQAAVHSAVTIVVSSGAPAPAPAPNVEMQRVFDTTGSDQAYAESTLASLGFSVNVQTEYSNTVQTGYVIRQNPQNGEAPKGSVVTIVVSSGAPPVDGAVVKDYASSGTWTEANMRQDFERQYAANGLVINVVYMNSANHKIGIVMAQDKIGEVPAGTVVTFTISSGVAVPNVVGKTEEEAKNVINGAGLAVSVSYEPSDAAVGTVTYQGIEAGSNVDPGRTIPIRVSRS